MADRPIRLKGYSHAIADAAKNQRRKDAQDRQAARDERSNVEQITRLDAGRYAAKKERRRLKNANIKTM